MAIRIRLLAGGLVVIGAVSGPALAQQSSPLFVSANDGLNEMADGAYRVRPNAAQGSLAGFDASQFPPRKLWETPVDHSVTGPPAGVAVSRDGHFAYVSNPAVLDPQHPNQPAAPAELQIVDLTLSPPAVIDKPALPTRPWGIALDREGALLLAASGKGAVYALKLEAGKIVSSSSIEVGPDSARVVSVAMTQDGRWALATKRGENTVAVLEIANGAVVYTHRDITTGSNPYSIAMSPDGKLAAISDIGRVSGDEDAVTLIDVSKPPFRAIGVVPVAATPETVVFSPDSRLMAVNSINGSNLAHDKFGYAPGALIQIFDITEGLPQLKASASVDGNAQGILFMPDSRHLIVQEFEAQRLALFDFDGAKLSRNETAIPLQAGPAAIAATFP